MREKQHPKATKNTCVVTARLRLLSQDRDQLQEYNRWSLSHQRCTHNIFYSQENIISYPTNTNNTSKKPCWFLFCNTSKMCVTWPGTGADVINNWFPPPPPSKYLQPTVRAGVSVSCAKVCWSRSWIHLRPPTTILIYRSLQMRYRHLVSWSEAGNSQYGVVSKHRGRAAVDE